MSNLLFLLFIIGCKNFFNFSIVCNPLLLLISDDFFEKNISKLANNFQAVFLFIFSIFLLFTWFISILTQKLKTAHIQKKKGLKISPSNLDISHFFLFLTSSYVPLRIYHTLLFAYYSAS